MYTIDGFITLKISRKDLELMINSLKVIIPKIEERHENFSVYKILLQELINVAKQWKEKENKYYTNKESKTR